MIRLCSYRGPLPGRFVCAGIVAETAARALYEAYVPRGEPDHFDEVTVTASALEAMDTVSMSELLWKAEEIGVKLIIEAGTHEKTDAAQRVPTHEEAVV